MKKFLFAMIALVAMVAVASGCSNSDNDFDYSKESIYGVWRITHIERKDGTMWDITTEYAEQVIEPTFATFFRNGTYFGEGYFGSGTGTYKAKGRTITCYVDGLAYLEYEILSLNENLCELRMRKPGSLETLKIRCKKLR